jgi:hypothetical protein
MKDYWKRRDLIVSERNKGTEGRNKKTLWNWILYINPSSPRRNGTNNIRKDYAISMAC